MSRNEQLIRQHKLLQLLEATRIGRTLEELRDDLVGQLGLTNLHIKSVKRDLEALEASGFSIESQYLQRGKVWRLAPHSKSAVQIQPSATWLPRVSNCRPTHWPPAVTGGMP